MSGQAGQAPDVVKVRLSGAPTDIDHIAALLAHNGVKVLDTFQTAVTRASGCT